jgi:phosphatidylserine/phosphatidylglycerophosphate/cardiolipin synthase-like enzyme
MSLALLALGIAPDFADHGDVAEQLVMRAAKHAIRISQQDLGFSLLHVAEPIWPEAIMRALADLIVKKHGEVFVVLSQPGAVSAAGTSYSTGVSQEQVAQKLRAVVHDRAGLPDPEIDALLCQSFHLAPLRFGPDDQWPGNLKIANHAKLWIVDDRAFRIGSHNLYPVNLQEFGYIVEDRRATDQLLKDYWDQLWRYSSAAAISGSEAKHCVFDKAAPAS